jgi:putative transcriptional regulator
LSTKASILAFSGLCQACLLLFVIMARKKRAENPEDMPALQVLREAAGLTQAQLASRIPDKSRKKTLSRQVISGWERGEYEPELTIRQVKALCRALGKSLEDLPDDFCSRSQLPTEDQSLTTNT